MEESSIGTEKGAPGLLTVLLADDHAVMRSGLRMLLDAEADIEVVAEAGDLPETMRRLKAHKPSVLVLDLNMPGKPSIPAIPDIREAMPDTQIVVLTMNTEPAFAREALRAGAAGYVVKDAAGEELVQAIRMAAEGRRYLNPELAASVAESPVDDGPPDLLTAREVEVLRSLALGHTNAEIAMQLFLSTRTIEAHRLHIQQKLDRSSRAELVGYALEHGLIDPVS